MNTSAATTPTTSTTGSRRMIVPLYNLQAHNVMANIIVDAGTDAKVTRFTKLGIEVLDLAVLEPVEVYPRGAPTGEEGGVPPRGSSGFSTRTVGRRLSVSGGAGKLQVSGDVGGGGGSGTTTARPSHSPKLEAPPAQTPQGIRNLFEKLFKKKDAAAADSESPAPKLAHTRTYRSSLDLPHPHDDAPPPVTGQRAPVLGVQPTVSAPTHPPRGRPGHYVWFVKRWLKYDSGGLLAFMKGVGQGQGEEGELTTKVEVRFEWKRGKAKRKGEGEEEEEGADSGEESDPEDSETPWRCTIHVRPLAAHHARSGGAHHLSSIREGHEPEEPGRSRLRINVGTLSPTPHHPKVVAMLKTPFPLPDVEIEHMVVRKREVGTGAGLKSAHGLVLTAEEIKDVVVSTGLWLAVREGFGGIGKVSRKSDG
ncbi:hypothetical protein FB451DRAFT_101833 [Mycena latifolia]|nr:hypothetical protein FB451DRAFT_101833 [Mycena latifolia]